MTDKKQAIEQLTELKAAFAATASAFHENQWLEAQYGHYQQSVQSAINNVSASELVPARSILENLKKTFDERARINKAAGTDILSLFVGISHDEIIRTSEAHSKKVEAVLKLI